MSDTIQCEQGLGDLPRLMCSGRWKIANGKASGTNAARTAELRASVCNGCEHGESRATGVRMPARAARLHVLSKVEVRERLLAARAPAAQPDPEPSSDLVEHQAPRDENERADEQPAQPAAPSAVAVASCATMDTCALPGCDVAFQRVRNQRFCSPEHTAESVRQRRNAERAVAAGREPLAGQTRDCRACGDSFKPKHGNERFCQRCKDAVPASSRTRTRTEDVMPASIEPPAPLETSREAAGHEAETNNEERPMREATCQETSCSRTFRVKSDRGALPKRCPDCRGGASSKPARRADSVAPKGGGLHQGSSCHRRRPLARRPDRARGRAYQSQRQPARCSERAPKRGCDRGARGADRRAARGELSA